MGEYPQATPDEEKTIDILLRSLAVLSRVGLGLSSTVLSILGKEEKSEENN